jgi:acyl phosphate:glycerol-3-phosphate acyltransferase
MVTAAAVLVAAYLVGCISTAYYIVRLRTGRDLRREGSGTLGARNAGRILGRGGFALVMIGDLLKGAAAVGLVHATSGSTALAGAAVIAAVAGHMYPVQLGFHGGKGLATATGGLIVLAPAVLAPATVVLLGLFAATRNATLAAVAATLTLPVSAWFLAGGAVFPPVLGLAALLLFRHRRSAADAHTGPSAVEAA